MNFIFRIFRFLFTIYAAIIFGLSFLIVIPCYFIVFNLYSKEKAPHLAHKISRAWAKLIYILFFIRVKIENRQLINPRKTYVFISNHLSFLDIPLFALSCANTFRFLSKAELASIPVLGYIINNLYITVDRSDKNDRSLSIKKMKQSLDEHISVFLCPEGTRNQTKDPLLPFKDGAFRLAHESGNPIAVLTIFNSNKLLDSKRWFELAPGIIYAAWSEPIEPGNYTPEQLKEIAKNKMMRAMDKHRKKQHLS